MKKILLVLVMMTQLRAYTLAKSAPSLKLLLSAALVDHHKEHREEQYRETARILSLLGYINPYIVEGVAKSGPSYLDELSTNVFYAQVGDQCLINYGINEARTMLEAIEHFDFADDDMIVKLTGRYQPQSALIFEVAQEALMQGRHAVVKFDYKGNVLTLAFAMRCKYMKDMFATMDYKEMEEKRIPIERMVARYIKEHEEELSPIFLANLDMHANLLGSSDKTGIYLTGIDSDCFESW